jgi:hypothetical protein
MLNRLGFRRSSASKHPCYFALEEILTASMESGHENSKRTEIRRHFWHAEPTVAVI